MIQVPEEVLNIFKKSAYFIGHLHIKPDADSTGAMLALRLGLEQLGKVIDLYCEDSVPTAFSFLPGVDHVGKTTFEAVQAHKDAVYLFVDTAKWQLATYQDTVPSYPRPLVNIDHHPDNNVVADLSWINPIASSSCEMIFELLKALQVDITPDVATCLTIGLLGDTGTFQNQNVNQKSFLIAAELMTLGADYQKCVLHLTRTKSMESFQTQGFIASKLKLSDDGKYVWISIGYEDWQKNGASSTSEIANEIISRVEGTMFGAVLIEKEPGITKGSARARLPNVDVSSFARLMNGGGHKAAAGFKLDMPIAKAEQAFLAAVTKSKILDTNVSS